MLSFARLVFFQLLLKVAFRLACKMRYPCSFRDAVRAVASGTFDINYFLGILRKGVASENQGGTEKNGKDKVFHIEIQY